MDNVVEYDFGIARRCGEGKRAKSTAVGVAPERPQKSVDLDRERDKFNFIFILVKFPLFCLF